MLDISPRVKIDSEYVIKGETVDQVYYALGAISRPCSRSCSTGSQSLSTAPSQLTCPDPSSLVFWINHQMLVLIWARTTRLASPSHRRRSVSPSLTSSCTTMSTRGGNMLKSALFNTQSRRQKWHAFLLKKCIEFIRLDIVASADTAHSTRLIDISLQSRYHVRVNQGD